MACLVKTVNCSHVYVFYNLFTYISHILLEMFKDGKGAVHERRTDHTMDRTTRTTNDLQAIFDISLQNVHLWILLIIIN